MKECSIIRNLLIQLQLIICILFLNGVNSQTNYSEFDFNPLVTSDSKDNGINILLNTPQNINDLVTSENYKDKNIDIKLLTIPQNVSTSQNNDFTNKMAQLNEKIKVKVYHFTIPHWADSTEGEVACDSIIQCEWTFSDHIKNLRQKAIHDRIHSNKMNDKLITVSAYNVHSWWERARDHFPAICELKTNLTLVESEESFTRYAGNLFDPTFKNFDGFSTTHPTSALQRVYIDAFLNSSNFIHKKMHDFSYLIKGASYVASDCHKRDNANANRDSFVQLLRKEGFRIDGLGRCMHTPTGPEGVALPTSKEMRYNLQVKREAIGRFMFNMAFENSLEPGYVTEKPFDALISGTVPVYLGDAIQLKSLLPHPKAAIFIADFKDMTELAKYLIYLTNNESAYEEHRAWRHDFSYEKNIIGKPLLQKSWYCRVCEWAVKTAPLHHKRTRICKNDIINEGGGDGINLNSLNGKVVRHSKAKQLFFVEENKLRSIPDMSTFLSLGLDLTNIIVLSDSEMKNIAPGYPLERVK